MSGHVGACAGCRYCVTRESGTSECRRRSPTVAGRGSDLGTWPRIDPDRPACGDAKSRRLDPSEVAA